MTALLRMDLRSCNRSTTSWCILITYVLQTVCRACVCAHTYVLQKVLRACVCAHTYVLQTVCRACVCAHTYVLQTVCCACVCAYLCFANSLPCVRVCAQTVCRALQTVCRACVCAQVSIYKSQAAALAANAAKGVKIVVVANPGVCVIFVGGWNFFVRHAHCLICYLTLSHVCM